MTVLEIQEVIEMLKNSKSPVKDNVTTVLVKCGGGKLVTYNYKRSKRNCTIHKSLKCKVD